MSARRGAAIPLAVVLPLAMLAGCSDEGASAQAKPADPVMTSALRAPLLVDPDLSQFNARRLAIEPPGPNSAPLNLAPQPVTDGHYDAP